MAAKKNTAKTAPKAQAAGASRAYAVATKALMLDPWQTSLEAAKMNTLQSSKLIVDHLNSEAKRIYLQNFKDWVTMVEAGKISNANPPQPPNGWAVVMAEDGFSYPAQGGGPVCDMPPVPADYSKTVDEIKDKLGPYHMEIGKHIDGVWWVCGQYDTCPVNFRTPPLPAAAWPENSVFVKVGAAVGPGWWMKVA